MCVFAKGKRLQEVFFYLYIARSFSNCQLTVDREDPLGNAVSIQDPTPAYRWSVGVVGLQGHGKTALCGRLVQQLGGTSNSSKGRVRNAARRQCPDADQARIIDAIWLMDRMVLERREGTTVSSKEFPLFHHSTGSFALVDTPSFVSKLSKEEEQQKPRRDLPRLKYRAVATPSINWRFPTAGLSLSVSQWTRSEKPVVQSLILQVIAATGSGLKQVLFAVTKMDKVLWREDVFYQVHERIHSVMADFSPCLTFSVAPVSAVVPAHGIAKLTRTDNWEKPPAARSVLTVLESYKPKRSNYKDNDSTSSIAVVFDHKRLQSSVVPVKTVQGTFRLGESLASGQTRKCL